MKVSTINDFTVLGALLMIEEIAEHLVKTDDTFTPEHHGASAVLAELHKEKRAVRIWTSLEDPENVGENTFSESSLIIAVDNSNSGMRVHFYKSHNDDMIGYPEHVDTVSVADRSGTVYSGWGALVERTIKGLFLEIFADVRNTKNR